MTEEFNLSDKEFDCNISIGFDDDIQQVILSKDVKKFIRRLKEEVSGLKGDDYVISIIDKLAGEKLK